MMDRSKYSLNGVYRCENFADRAQNNFPRVPIGSAGGINGWYIQMRILEGSNPPDFFPFISCNDKPTVRLRRFFNVIKKNGSSCFKKQGSLVCARHLGPIGCDMCIVDLLNDENGYLDDDGGLTVEYGIHVDAILEDDGIWKFNFDDKVFGCDENKNSVTFQHTENDFTNKKLYCPAQLLSFHSSMFLEMNSNVYNDFVENSRVNQCLQIAHGVRCQLDIEYWMIVRIAHRNKLRNVVKYCDQQTAQMFYIPTKETSDTGLFGNALLFGLRHLLASLLRRYESLEDLVEILKILDIKKMQGESMKMLASKIFKNRT